MLTSGEPPPSSVLSRWLVLSVTSHRRSSQCPGPVATVFCNSSCITTSTSTTPSSGCTWSIPTVFSMVGTCLCVTNGTFSTLSVNWVCGIATVFRTTCGTCWTVSSTSIIVCTAWICLCVQTKILTTLSMTCNRWTSEHCPDHWRLSSHNDWHAKITLVKSCVCGVSTVYGLRCGSSFCSDMRRRWDCRLLGALRLWSWMYWHRIAAAVAAAAFEEAGFLPASWQRFPGVRLKIHLRFNIIRILWDILEKIRNTD